jgi:peptidyl-prolyl cis-trans isomerase SurA
MSDPDAINRLTREAFKRSLKDIHAAHIFISFKNASRMMDKSAADKKLEDVTKRLAKGEDFMAVAQQLSDDPSAKSNKGDLNYITVFTLPYEFENIVYTTAPGKISKPYQSKAGYHIFKNLGERKALGKIKIQQILLAFPPDADEATRKKIAYVADTVYRKLKAGEEFSKLASAYSNDYVSAASEGNIPDIAVGQFEPAFERTIWNLKDNEISKPFATAHGYHIVKRVMVKPVSTDTSDKATTDALHQKIMSDERWKTARDFIYDIVKNKAGVHKQNYDEPALWAFSDSLLDYKPGGTGRKMDNSTVLFKIADSSFTAGEWIGYAQLNRYKSDRSVKTYVELMDEFVKNGMYQYYRDHLEDFNEEFRNQMNEFRDGNLFFEIMQQEVWNKAQTDSAALLALYERNKGQYNWKQSAEAVIFFCNDEASAKTLMAQLKKDPGSWKKAAEALNDKVVADSARYEWTQIPGLESAPKENTVTAITINETDKTASFALIGKVYEQPSPRSFNEAKGLVMNDYQAQLEEDWIKTLKKKYPVVVDQKVLQDILK